MIFRATMDHELEPLFRAFGPLTEQEGAIVAAAVTTHTVGKGTILLDVGAVCDQAYLVVSGGLRTLFWDPKGKEVTRYVALQGQVCTVLDSFISREESRESIEAFLDSTVIVWDRDTQDRLRRTIPSWNEAYIRILERAQVLNAWRLVGLLGMNAAQRYAALLEEWPEMVRDVPDRIIASYLGMAPEYLSRLKARVLHGLS